MSQQKMITSFISTASVQKVSENVPKSISSENIESSQDVVFEERPPNVLFSGIIYIFTFVFLEYCSFQFPCRIASVDLFPISLISSFQLLSSVFLSITFANWNEQYSRKKNVKIYNMPENRGEKLPVSLINQLKEKLDINIDRSDIVAMHRIPGRPAAPRPILIKFVLGPLLFLTYINAMPEMVKSSETKLFADDSLLFCIINNQADSVLLQNKLASLQDWEDKWQMSFKVPRRFL
jgi:hypothetical protein